MGPAVFSLPTKSARVGCAASVSRSTASRAQRAQWNSDVAERQQRKEGQWPPPPPPPPGFPGSEESIKQVALDGRVLSGTIIAGCVSLAAVYGFNNPSPSLMTQRYVMPTASTTAAQAGAWREAPPLPGSKNGALPMYAEPGIFGNEKQALPSTVPSGESPVGLESTWLHQWCYDANGQPFVRVKDRWMRIRRPPGTKLQVELMDTEGGWKGGRLYSMRLPKGWPLEEMDLTNQKTMALLFGMNKELENLLEPVLAKS